MTGNEYQSLQRMEVIDSTTFPKLGNACQPNGFAVHLPGQAKLGGPVWCNGWLDSVQNEFNSTKNLVYISNRT